MSAEAANPIIENNDRMHWPVDPFPDIPRFSKVLKLCKQKASDGSLPYYESIDLLDFAEVLPSLALSKREGDDYRFEYFGTDFVDLFADDFTGKLLCECVAPATKAATQAYFAELCAGPLIGRTTGRVPAIGRDYLQFDVLDLPLLSELNDVSHFLHAIVREPGY